MCPAKSRSKSIRGRSGQNQVEFAATFVVLILFVVLPLVNLSAIPVRMGLAQALVRDEIARLAKAEKFSAASLTASGASELGKRLQAIGGVTPRQMKLELRMTQSSPSGKSYSADRPGQLPPEWLPDGSNCPCHAELVFVVELDISPLLLSPSFGQNIPGLTAPFAMHITESAPWENLGRDPQTGEFFLNE